MCRPSRTFRNTSIVSHLAPMISLPHSGIEQVSLWAILSVSFVGGVFSGFLGGGAGYIRMPSMVFLLGVPTHVAVGTDLFEIVISAGYWNGDSCLKRKCGLFWSRLSCIPVPAIGAQVGAGLTRKFPRVAHQDGVCPLASHWGRVGNIQSGNRATLRVAKDRRGMEDTLLQRRFQPDGKCSPIRRADCRGVSGRGP